MKERQSRLKRIVAKVRYILSGPSDRSIIHFNPPADSVAEMYRVVDRGIQEEVDRRREALEAKKRLKTEEARTNALKAGAVKKLQLRSAQQDRRNIIQEINLAKQGGGASDPKYAPVMASWEDQLRKAKEIIARLSKE